MDLKIGIGEKVAIVAIGEVTLHLLGRTIITLDACYFVTSIIKKFIIILCSIVYRYKLVLENNGCSILLYDKIIMRGILHMVCLIFTREL